jgi:hypothetical protein
MTQYDARKGDATLYRNVHTDCKCRFVFSLTYLLTYLLTCLLTYLLTYLLTPWCRVLQNLTGFAASQEIPRIYGTRKFITVLTSARQLSLS